ncbi:hypothetical protein KPL70_023166 [Citrus sinensis]|nr:hypothetical protein KPL70_023166 [Citrus sinensis]
MPFNAIADAVSTHYLVNAIQFCASCSGFVAMLGAVYGFKIKLGYENVLLVRLLLEMRLMRMPSIQKFLIVVFVGLCLVGVWMLMSSSVVPDSTNGDGDDVPVEKSENRVEDNQEEKYMSEGDGEMSESKNMVNQNQEENIVKESFDENTESEEESKAVSENDDGRKREDEESKSESDQDNDTESRGKDQASTEIFPSGDQSKILKETNAQNGAWSTQPIESQNETISQQSSIFKDQYGHRWKICGETQFENGALHYIDFILKGSKLLQFILQQLELKRKHANTIGSLLDFAWSMLKT